MPHPAPERLPAETAVSDPFGRRISYLRVSATDRCNLRCVYCMPERARFLPPAEVLTLAELARLCGVFIGLGVRKLRISGGEPLVRRGILDLFGSLGAHLGRGLDELTLTTNGTRLAHHAAALAAAGVRRVNVSLDTLDPAVFSTVTRGAPIRSTLDGIAAARDAGLTVKVNAVVLKGVNDYTLDALLTWCGEHRLDLCLIETMPIGEVGVDRATQFVSLADLRASLEQRWTLLPSAFRTGGPARYVKVAETGQHLGFITAMSHCFCDRCNRVRLGSDGRLYPCLGHEIATDLRGPLRAGASDADLAGAIRQAIARKPERHSFDALDRRPAVSRPMAATGG